MARLKIIDFKTVKTQAQRSSPTVARKISRRILRINAQATTQRLAQRFAQKSVQTSTDKGANKSSKEILNKSSNVAAMLKLFGFVAQRKAARACSAFLALILSLVFLSPLLSPNANAKSNKKTESTLPSKLPSKMPASASNGSAGSSANASSNNKQIPFLTEILNQYRASQALELKTHRKIHSELLNQTQEQTGLLYLAGSKIRWEFSEPEKSVVIFDGVYFWNIQSPPAEFPDGPNQVVKTKANSNSKDQIVLTSVLGKEPLSKFFHFDETNVIGKDGLEYVLSPLKKDRMGAKKVLIQVSKSKKLVTRVTYIDDVGNATEVDLLTTQFKNEIKSGLFHYKPNKTDKVNEL